MSIYLIDFCHTSAFSLAIQSVPCSIGDTRLRLFISGIEPLTEVLPKNSKTKFEDTLMLSLLCTCQEGKIKRKKKISHVIESHEGTAGMSKEHFYI